MKYFEKQGVFVTPEAMVTLKRAVTSKLLKGFSNKGPEYFGTLRGKALNSIRETLKPFESPELMNGQFYSKVREGMKESLNKFKDMMNG